MSRSRPTAWCRGGRRRLVRLARAQQRDRGDERDQCGGGGKFAAAGGLDHGESLSRRRCGPERPAEERDQQPSPATMRPGTGRGGAGSTDQPGDDAARNGPQRSGIISSSPASMRPGTGRLAVSTARQPRLLLVGPPWHTRTYVRSAGGGDCSFRRAVRAALSVDDAESAALVDRIGASWRAQNRGAAALLSRDR